MIRLVPGGLGQLGTANVAVKVQTTSMHSRVRVMPVISLIAWLGAAGCDSGDHGCGPDGLTCASDELCVKNQAQLSSYACKSNPCGDAPADCSCAQSVCESPFGACQVISNAEIACVCIVC